MANIRLDESTSGKPTVRQQTKDTIGPSHIDILVLERIRVQPGECYRFPVDFEINLPDTEYGLIQPIHGLSEKYKLILTSTTLHPKYMGRPVLVIHNDGHNLLELNMGQHIAQLIIVQAGTITLN